jgi:hypothetical protein
MNFSYNQKDELQFHDAQKINSNTNSLPRVLAYFPVLWSDIAINLVESTLS